MHREDIRDGMAPYAYMVIRAYDQIRPCPAFPAEEEAIVQGVSGAADLFR